VDNRIWPAGPGSRPPPVAGAAGAAVAALNTYNPNTLHLYTPPKKNFCSSVQIQSLALNCKSRAKADDLPLGLSWGSAQDAASSPHL